jgi:hypothetical protein
LTGGKNWVTRWRSHKLAAGWRAPDVCGLVRKLGVD